MADVKPQTRRYRSDKRAARAAGTRASILSAARRLFLARGWTGTTIADIAAAAGVSGETVYAAFGSKKEILRQLVVQAVRQARPDIPLIEQEGAARIARASEQARQIELFSGDVARVLARVAPLMEVVRVAAGADAEMAALHARLHRGRRDNLEWFAGMLLGNGPLRDGMDAKAAGDILWRLASPELFLLMRRVEKASLRTYADWLATSLKLLLLDR